MVPGYFELLHVVTAERLNVQDETIRTWRGQEGDLGYHDDFANRSGTAGLRSKYLQLGASSGTLSPCCIVIC
jgi:hypothetical protein